MSNVFSINRRQFIKAASGFTLAIPFLPSMAQGQSADFIKRFISMRTVYGQPPQLFYPANRPTNALSANVFHREIAAGQTLSPIINGAFSSISHKLSILRGIDHSHDGHNKTTMLCPGEHSGEGEVSSWLNSFDEVLASSSVIYPQVPQHRILRIHPNTSQFSPQGQYSFLNQQSRPQDTDMKVLHAKLFGSGIQSVAPTGIDKGRRRTKVVDLAKEAFDTLSRDPRLSASEGVSLEQYKDMLNDLGNKINNTSTLTCTPPGSVDNSTDYGVIYDIGVDMTILALSCGLTQVVSYAMPWFGALPGENHSAFHEFSHWTYGTANQIPDMGNGAENLIYANGSAEAARDTRFYSWAAEKVASIMTRMDGITESNGKTMLDNSLVYWGNEGGGGSGHNRYSLPTVIAGTLDGKVTPGYWDFTRRPFVYDANRQDIFHAAGTVTQTALLNTLANLYGVPAASYEKPGQGGFGDFRLNAFKYPFGNTLTASQLYSDYTGSIANQRKSIPNWVI
jgi:hypothetical protein